jgi:hypothetical protein
MQEPILGPHAVTQMKAGDSENEVIRSKWTAHQDFSAMCSTSEESQSTAQVKATNGEVVRNLGSSLSRTLSQRKHLDE